MQTSDESSQHFPTSPLAANSPIVTPNTELYPYSDNIPSVPAGMPTDSPPTHSEHSVAPPNSPVPPRPPPIESLFTTGDSDNSEKSENSSDAEEQPLSEHEVDFSAFRRARAKKKLVFKDVTKSAPRAKLKREDPMSVHSETQRMVRESKIRIPDYEPPVIRLQDVIRKLPKLTKPDANTKTVLPLPAPPVPLPTQTTSTPLSKRVPAQLACDDANELPEIDFTSDQPIGRLELTTLFDPTDQHKATLNQPTLSLPNDFTQLNIVSSPLEAFKNRFIQHSLPPPKPITAPTVSESAETAEPLLPPDALSTLSKKPGAVHGFLRERLRQSLLAKRIQEHEDMKIRLRYENEEYIPSEGSCSEAEDMDRENEPKDTAVANGSEELQPEALVENNNHNVTDNYSDSDSDSEGGSGDGNESESSELGETSDSEGELGECIKMPNIKAKRQKVNEDWDTGDEDSRLSARNIGDQSAVKECSQTLEIDSTSQEFIHSPNLSQSIRIETSNHEVITENEDAKEFDSSLILDSSLNYLPYLDKFRAPNEQDTFKVPSSFQLSNSQSQCSIPEGLKDLCDPTQEGEGEELLPFICSGRFTQLTQGDLSTRDDVTSLSLVTDVDSNQLDETVDADIPVLAPRKMRVKDQLRLQRYRQLAEFEEREAELSGSDPELEGSECGSEFGNELDEYESEDGDIDPVESEEVERLNAKYYNRIMLEDDAANMELLKEKFLPDQAIVEDGLRMKNGLFRKRKFNFDNDEVSNSATCDWCEEGRDQESDQLITQERRRRRVEREEYMSRKSVSSISDLAYGDTRTLPLADKPSTIRTISCDNTSTGLVIPSIRKSLGKHNSLLSRNFSDKSTKLDSNILSDSNSGSKLVSRKAFVFQSTRSLEGTESNSVPSLSKSVSVPAVSNSAVKKGRHFNKSKIQPELTKEITFLKPDSSVFHLLNVN